jgi:30S ribosomal protein S31
MNLPGRNCFSSRFLFIRVQAYFCTLFIQKKAIMGRGDKKTKKGKIANGSFGKARPARPATKKAAVIKKEA